MATRVLRPPRPAPVGAAAGYPIERAVAIAASLGLALLIVLGGVPQLLRALATGTRSRLAERR